MADRCSRIHQCQCHSRDTSPRERPEALVPNPVFGSAPSEGDAIGWPLQAGNQLDCLGGTPEAAEIRMIQWMICRHATLQSPNPPPGPNISSSNARSSSSTFSFAPFVLCFLYRSRVESRLPFLHSLRSSGYVLSPALSSSHAY